MDLMAASQALFVVQMPGEYVWWMITNGTGVFILVTDFGGLAPHCALVQNGTDRAEIGNIHSFGKPHS
jgi:hypothetical protein